ncbi:MAG: carboxypeptidase regulatory-like domain-containing protein [Bryobacterales bacterium]|nr:carboxypeptidase regulatory-like domain-containing protein [Bryobacterales bacterium]
MRNPLITLCCCLLLTFALSAQNSGVQGVVMDPSKAIVPGATVTITNLETSVTRRLLSNERCLYLFPSLSAGRHKVECSAQGFATRQVNELRLEVGQTARIDFELKTGTVVEAIEVSASGILINSETSEVGQ